MILGGFQIQSGRYGEEKYFASVGNRTPIPWSSSHGAVAVAVTTEILWIFLSIYGFLILIDLYPENCFIAEAQCRLVVVRMNGTAADIRVSTEVTGAFVFPPEITKDYYLGADFKMTACWKVT
jgi:hypothetical protein